MHVVMSNPEGEVLTRARAAERLGVTVATMARWAMQGRGPRYSLTGEVKGRAIYTAADLVEWLAERKTSPRACRGDRTATRGGA